MVYSYIPKGLSFSLDLENESGPRDLLIKHKVLMIQDATTGKNSCLGQRAQISWKVLFSGVIDDLDSLF